VIPSALHLFWKPSAQKLTISLAVASLGFFLFSFQVHEKSILLPLLPITMLFNEHPSFVVWFNNVSLFSLWPLLQRDHLQIPFFALLILWNALTYPFQQFHLLNFVKVQLI
jgi:alpha-1,3-glucosyltransferase